VNFFAEYRSKLSALSIAASTAVFSLVNAILLEPYPEAQTIAYRSMNSMKQTR